MTILFIALSVLGAGIAAFAGLILATLLAHVLGRGRFAEEGLDSGSFIVTSMIVGALANILAPVFSSARAKVHHVAPPPTSPWFYVVVPVLALIAVALCGFLWLALAGLTHRRTGFYIESNGTILNRKKEMLAPTAVQQNADYHETSMANGYAVYELTLLSGTKRLATNTYMSEEARDTNLDRLLSPERTPPCRSLDLTFVWRRSRLTWLQAAVSPEWTALLAQPKQFLPEEAVSFWRSLTLPTFSSQAPRTIAPEELRLRISELETLASQHSPDPASPELLYNDWGFLMEFARLVEGPVIAITNKGFKEMAVEAVGGPAHATYGSSDGDDRRFLVTIDRQDGKPMTGEEISEPDEVGEVETVER